MTTVSRLLLVCAAFALVACNAPAPDGAATTDAPTPGVVGDSDEAVGSYTRGFLMGRQAGSPLLDEDAFIAGLRTALAGDESQFDEARMRAAFEALGRLEMEADNAEAQANIAAGEAFLAENAQRDGVVTTDSGLQYEVIVEGDGARPTASNVVRVHYHGTTIDGEVFDSSVDRGTPSEFSLSQVVEGWTEGLQLMNVGSKYMLWVPHHIGYGTQRRAGAVFGPGSTLVFEVELLEIVR